MRDSRRGRLVLAMLLLTAFTLITLDYRSGSGGPLRSLGNSVFGPVERAVGAVASPVGSFFSGLGHLNSYKSENSRLREQNQRLLEQLRLTDADRAHLDSAEKLLNLAGRAQFRIVAARVVAYGGTLGFESTATIDVGTNDGVHKNQTVINGDGLVGKTLDVGPTTSTILLGNDPNFTAGARLEGSQQIGHVDGGGRNPMTITLLGAQATMAPGDRLVTFGDRGDRPFVPEVPIGRVLRIQPTPGQLFRSAVVAPYVDFSSVDIVGVVVDTPRTVKRDSLLPPSPTPSPGTPASPASPDPSSSGTPGTKASGSPSPGRTP
ncbi:MAG: rod shape-determining protein MreC [Frankiaceae bacterium]|jgi:rod shape-determining protein MreC|nr:rod shape-determining protein MreC [Frankiaceae bacterium]